LEILHKGIVRETRNGLEAKTMVADDRRIRIITGHYGSGKTEFAVNYVKKLRESVDGRPLPIWIL
jgi:tRNA A37 threonylcarbamoyladenosine biosynthesis protein TsaE